MHSKYICILNFWVVHAWSVLVTRRSKCFGKLDNLNRLPSSGTGLYKSIIAYPVWIKISQQNRCFREHMEGWESDRLKLHFSNYTGQPKQNFYKVWSDLVNWFQLFIIKTFMDDTDSTFASRKSSFRAFIWYIHIYITGMGIKSCTNRPNTHWKRRSE